MAAFAASPRWGSADVLCAGRDAARPRGGLQFGGVVRRVHRDGHDGEQGLEAAMRLWSAELTQQKRWRAYFELSRRGSCGFNAGFSLRDAR